ncbi:MAG: single-stranded DNA-binding protein [Bacteroidetes bacterium]|jgi:single-strand DNA-binding protein|nr:single-stranded DNA-binding protein [Bacteroidota bacterium]
MINQTNNVKMVVNLGTKPTIKTVTGGRKMARFSVAAIEPEAETGKKIIKWYSVISWGSVADMAERCLEKGKRVMVCGHLVTKTWTDKKGIERTRKEILATHLVLLHSGTRSTLPNAA